MEGLASWAPDWSRPSTVRPLHHYSMGPSYDYRLEDSYIFIQNPPVLACFGQHLDVIRRQGGDLSSSLASLIETPVRARSTHPAEDLMDVFRRRYEAWRWLIGVDILPALPEAWEDSDFVDEIFEGKIPALPETECSFGLLLAAHLVIRPSWEDLDPLENPENPALSAFLCRRKVAVTANGWLGVVPRSTREGDVVVAARLGQDTEAWVLRQSRSQRDEGVDAQIRGGFNKSNARLCSEDGEEDEDCAFPPRGDALPIEHYEFVGQCALECLQGSNTDQVMEQSPWCFFAIH